MQLSQGSRMTVVANSHIFLDERGVPRIEGAGTRVVMVVMDKLNGLTPEQIHAAYSHLSLSQIHAALAYYYDHQDELDQEIARESKDIAAWRRKAIAEGTQPTRDELQARLRQREKNE
jgi:uncharacterized protein (DUF433 family)